VERGKSRAASWRRRFKERHRFQKRRGRGGGERRRLARRGEEKEEKEKEEERPNVALTGHVQNGMAVSTRGRRRVAPAPPF
jgi:hypothetical protein